MDRHAHQFKSICATIVIAAAAWPNGSACAAFDEPPVEAFDESSRDYLAGNGLLQRGLNELAIDEYRRFLSQHANHEKAPVARYGLAVALFRLNRLEDAAEELAKLSQVRDFEFAAEVATMRGQCHLAAGRYDEAAAAFSPVAESMSAHDLADDAAAGLAEALYRAREYKAAVEKADTFNTRWPKSPLLERVEFFAAVSQVAVGDFEAAAARFEAFLKNYPRSPFSDQATLRLAQCLQKSGSIEQAIRRYQDVVERGAAAQIPDALFALGGLYFQNQAYDQAGASLDRLLEIAPKSPYRGRALLQRGHVHFALEQFDEALKAFESASRAEPDLVDRCAYWAAKCQFRQERFADAAARLGKASAQFRSSPLLPEMYYDQSVALIRAGKASDAATVLARFHADFPEHSLAPHALHLLAGITHQEGEYDRSAEHCRDFLKQFSSDALAGSVAFLAGENEFLSGRFDRAAEIYQQFLKEHPTDSQAAMARLRLAISFYRLEKFDEAEPLLLAATPESESNESFRSAWLALGDIYFRRGEWKQAETALSNYVSGNEGGTGADDALAKLAYAKQQQGRHSDALADYEKHIATYPDSPNRFQSLFERGQTLVALGKTPDAARAFEHVLAESGDDSRFGPYCLNHLGSMALQRGDHESAAGYYARAGRSTDGGMSAELTFQEAQAYMTGRDFARAETTLRRLLDAHPDFNKSALAAAQLAIALARQDRHEEAIAAMTRIEQGYAQKLDETQWASLQYEKAWCLRATGREAPAAEAYRKLLTDSPNSELALHARLELGEIEAKAGRFESAAEVLGELLKQLDQRDEKPPAELHQKCLYRLAVSEFELKRFEPSAEHFEMLLADHPGCEVTASASFFAGEANFNLGRHEKAVSHFTRVGKEHAGDPVAGPSLLRLGECLAVLQRWAAAERAFEDYLSKFADSQAWYQARFGVGWARENQKRYDDAIREYEKVIARHQGPTAARAQFQIGQCLFARNDFENAARELLKVDILYAYPEWSAAALFEAGRCFEKIGKPTEAKKQFQQVVERHRDSEWGRMAGRRLDELASTAGVPGR